MTGVLPAEEAAYPKPWTSGTKGKITGTPVIVEIKSKADMEKQKGKLKGAIVFTQQPRKTQPVFQPIARRLSVQDLQGLMETPIPVKPRVPPRSDKPGELKWEELEAFYRAEEVSYWSSPVPPIAATTEPSGSMPMRAAAGII